MERPKKRYWNPIPAPGTKKNGLREQQKNENRVETSILSNNVHILMSTTFRGILEINVVGTKVYLQLNCFELRECSGSFEDVSSNTVTAEFRSKMLVLLDTSDKDPLHFHCYQVNDCQKNIFVNKRRLAFLY